MPMDYHIILGTAGWGVWHSGDAGKSWTRHRKPFPLNSRIQALAVLPGEPRGLVAAGDTGIFRSLDGDRKSTRLNSSHGYISYAVFCLKKKNKPIFFMMSSRHPNILIKLILSL